MRRTLAALLSAILFAYPCFGHNWESYGPIDIPINNCYFHDTSPHYNVLCTSTGILIDDTQEWHEYSYSNLPVWDALHLSSDSVIVVMGDSSWSDGIWAFNRQAEEFQILEWCLMPHFILHYQSNETYYVGHAYGLLKSTNGINWEGVPHFDGKDCVTMAGHENYLVVSTGLLSTGIEIHYSSDGGEVWDRSPGAPYICDMTFLDNGMLYGIFPDNSYSSGLWSSRDHGETWEVEFWWTGMSSVGRDCNNTLFVGWEDAVGRSEGAAIWVPELADLTFINEDLPNLGINKIKMSHLVDCPSAICCTDSGAHFVTDYLYPTVMNSERIDPNTGRLSWNVVAGADYYDLYRDTNAYFPAQGTPWQTVGGSVTHLDFTCGISDDTTQYFFLGIARNDEAEETNESNSVGEFDFALDDPER